MFALVRGWIRTVVLGAATGSATEPVAAALSHYDGFPCNSLFHMLFGVARIPEASVVRNCIIRYADLDHYPHKHRFRRIRKEYDPFR